ncbi:MAG: CDP-alcohol phosphatidyltransferase family protein [Candidatus Glassbacteria bacterium]
MGKNRLRYEDTIKSDEVEEWIAKIFLRPVAFRIVVLLYETKIHSVHVTLAFLLTGIVAAWLITSGAYPALFTAALLIQAKSILDAVDGQLARARNAPSRVGRFFDSAADFVTSLALIMATAFLLYERTGESAYIYTGLAVFLLSGLQNSFWVYYNVYYRNIISGSGCGILQESRSEVVYPYDEDKKGILAFLRAFYRLAYGWQDIIIALLDGISLKIAGVREKDKRSWYGNVGFLRACGPLGLGSHLLAMSMALVLNRPSYYFVFTIYVASAYMIILLLYHVVSFTFAGRDHDVSYNGH